MHPVVKTPVLGKSSKDINNHDLKNADIHGIMGRTIDSYMKRYGNSSYENPLLGIAVTYHVPLGSLDAVLTLANIYMDFSPAIKVLDKASQEEWRQWDSRDASSGPINQDFVSPFIGMTTQQMAQIVRQNHESTCINGRWFYIADAQTAHDATLLLVEIPLHHPERPRSVRVFPALVNREAENLITCQGGFQFLLDAADNGNIYRGYEERLDDNLEEHGNRDVNPLLNDMTRPATDINIDDPISGETFMPNSSLMGEVDVYRGYVDKKVSYEPSECGTITEDDLNEDLDAELEHNGATGGNDSAMNVVDNAQTDADEGDMEANGEDHEAHEGEIDSVSASDEGYGANDHVDHANADGVQSVSDEGYAEDGHVDQAEHGEPDANDESDNDDGSYQHSEHGNAAY